LPARMPLARGGLQADGVVVDIDESTGKALSIERLQIPVAALEDEEAGTPTGEKADE
jgi:calcineurin-like phosphoesterase